MSQPLVMKSFGIGIGPLLSVTGTFGSFLMFFEEFITKCLFKWQLEVMDKKVYESDHSAKT